MHKAHRTTVAALLVSILTSGLAGCAIAACGSTKERPVIEEEDVDPIGVEAGPSFAPLPEGGPRPGCVGLECQQVTCSDGKKTTLTGTVVAPTPPQYGKADPIYNAILYVPNADLEPFAEGVSCDKCGAVTGKPLVTTLSGADGKFTLEDVPAGKDVPIVIQVGRWRRRVVIPEVERCTENKLDLEQTRLPRTKEEGDIPLIAIATSPYDPTECILRKIGIADKEFTAPGEGGRVHLYQGGGAALEGSITPPASNLWSTTTALSNYDMVAFPCQTGGGPTQEAHTNIQEYADRGGRIFITDLSQSIIQAGPGAWPSTAIWTTSAVFQNPALIDTTFPKGAALADWLVAIGATPTRGQLDLNQTFGRLTQANPPSQRWVFSSETTQTYSFNTPVGEEPDKQCGRVVYSSFHIATGGGALFPSECNSASLTTQEKVLEFLLFDLASCIQVDAEPPEPPPVR